MMRRVYSAALYGLSPLLLGYMAWRARGTGARWEVLGRARFGCPAAGDVDADASSPGHAAPWDRSARPIWVHAVSLGETRAAQPLIDALLARGEPVLLTHMTPTGRAQGARAHAQALASGQLRQAWLPYDFPGATRRFMRHHQPRLGILIERELWPNLVHAAQAAGVPLMLASARLSPAALALGQRWARLLRPAYAALDAVCAQTADDAQRLAQLGARHVTVCGNIKFDRRLDAQQVADGQAFAASLARPVIALASLREGEEGPFLQAVAAVVQSAGASAEPAPLFLFIPRHPQRFEWLAAQIQAAGLSCVRRSALRQGGAAGEQARARCRDVAVLLGDSLGEMPWYYAGSAVAIVGGSFAPLGGQDFIEASALGRPVLVGPHTAHFAQAVADARAAGALQVVADAPAAVAQALRWVADPAAAQRVGAAGCAWVGQHAGAVQRVLDGVDALLRA